MGSRLCGYPLETHRALVERLMFPFGALFLVAASTDPMLPSPDSYCRSCGLPVPEGVERCHPCQREHNDAQEAQARATRERVAKAEAKRARRAARNGASRG